MFFVTDNIEKKKLKLIDCPTAKMIVNFGTKPVQGSIFIRFRDKIQDIWAEDFDKYKRQYVETLKQYDLHENKVDLFDI